MARGRSGFVYLTYAALVLLSTPDCATASSIWAVDIDYSPAPSPEEGPPFSANASRDLSLLPYQIVGIVGSYLATIFIIGTLLLTLGRTLRRSAQSVDVKATEMVRPYGKTFGASPTSPGSQGNWYSPRKIRLSRGSTSRGNAASPAGESIVSFDDTVIQNDRQRRQDEMERLYAVVMAEDEARSQPHVNTNDSIVPPPEYSSGSPPRLHNRLPHLHVPSDAHAAHQEAQSPKLPKSPVRAIYPPDGPMPPMPTSPASPIRAGAYFPQSHVPPYLPSLPSSPAESRWADQTQRASSSGSRGTGSQNKLHKTIRSLKISAPIQYSRDNDDDMRTPLSPRSYIDPGIPPEPPTARTFDSQYTSATPGLARSHDYPDDFYEAEDGYDNDDQFYEIPQSYPTLTMSSPQAQSRLASQRSAASINNPLPFRAMQQAAANNNHQRQGPSSPNSLHSSAWPLSPSATWNNGYPLSAGPVKTTFLETRARGVPGSTLQTPRTGIATPYSPYMPFTPLTPVTPRLATRAERRQREREERREMGVVTEEDAVLSEDEIWRSVY
nr:hypothetical protein CFP56_64639 [Quercus suber]